MWHEILADVCFLLAIKSYCEILMAQRNLKTQGPTCEGPDLLDAVIG